MTKKISLWRLGFQLLKTAAAILVQLKRHPRSFLVNNIAIHWWFGLGPQWSYKAWHLVFACLLLVSIVASFKVFCCNCYNKLVGHTETVRLNSIYKLQKQLYCFEIVWIKKFRHMRPWRQLDRDDAASSYHGVMLQVGIL